jgi:hypothetical protein
MLRTAPSPARSATFRTHLTKFGIVVPVGRKGVTELLHVVADPNDKRVPEVARTCLAALSVLYSLSRSRFWSSIG